MMEQRTLDIIYICKHPSNKYWEGVGNCLDAVKNYIAEDCMIEADWLSDRDMLDIMYDVMRDYLDHCDKPSFFMWQLKDVLLRDSKNLPLRIAVALSLVQVRDNGNYINGFDDRLRRLDKEGITK